jgi:hypothetical protein
MTYMIRLRGETEERAIFSATREDAEHNARVIGLAPEFGDDNRLTVKMTDDGLRRLIAGTQAA